MSNITIHLGNLEMLRSLYDYKSTFSKALSFKAHEFFILHQANTKHKNWWQVINENGEVGFIPNNYVETVTVSPMFYLNFLDSCIGYLKHNEISPKFLLSNKEEMILRLHEMKRQIQLLPEVTDSIAMTENLPALLFENEDGEIENIKRERLSNSNSKEQVTVVPEKLVENENNTPTKNDSISEEVPLSNASQNVKISPTITRSAVYDLIESVRTNTQLSYELSKVAVGTVIQGLHDLLPANVFPYLSTILTHVDNCIGVDNVQINQTHDASRLKVIFDELTSCKEDSQQRSWMLHEDEKVIVDYLTELLSILSNADCAISKYMLSSDDFNVVNTLIQYYQMETRWSIRQLLLQAFGVMCSLDKTIISIMINSVLPAELARDMTANPRHIAKLNYSVLLLTIIYSMGEPMPVTDLQYLGETFLSFILNHIEYPPETDLDEQIPDMFINFILSFNLQFTCYSDNVIMKALSHRDVTKTFTEKILLLLNREEDPARIFEHEPAPDNSVIKMFNDLFSITETANIFYTNDIKVLIDIIVRNISDLSPGEKRRTNYLELCRRVLRTTNYEDHFHRRDDLLKCFTRIFCEETEQSKVDQSLVKELLKEFPHYFKLT